MAGPGFMFIGEEEKKEVMDVLESGWFFRYGSESDTRFKRKVYTLEQEVQVTFNVPHALAVTSGTAALITALAALGIGPGDEVIVPGYTFIASISSIINRGAVPVLAEIDESLTLDVEDVKRKITSRTRAIMAVHMLGNPCDLDSLSKIAKDHNLYLIEDAAQAFGGYYHGKALGTIGDIGIYSLNIFKTITSGDGGLVVTSDKNLYERSFAYHDQGHLPLRTGTEIGNRSIIGQNFRMNELTGAVALAQFRKIGHIIKTLHHVKDTLKAELYKKVRVGYRVLNDSEGECATLLTLLLDTPGEAKAFAERIGTKPLNSSGWHVYTNMEQLLQKKTVTSKEYPFHSKEYPTDVEYHKGMLPRTDEILSRAVNISIGVIDAGLGAPYGANPKSSDTDVEAIADKIAQTLLQVRAL